MAMQSPKIVVLTCLLCLGGCTKETPNDAIKSLELAKENSGKILPLEEGRRFTDQELKAASLVRDHIEAAEGRKLDARYTLEKNDEGWMVTVYFVGGYQHGSPSIATGLSGGYQVSEKTGDVELTEPGM